MVKYISLGTNCLPAMMFRNIYIKEETLPFDWTPNTISVVLDCLKNDFSNFTNFKDCINNELNEELVEEYIFHKTKCIHNYYYNWFPHSKIKSIDKLKIQLNRRIKRFLDILKSDDNIIFVFSNEPAIYRKSYLIKQDIYYKKLLEICDILINKYRKFNFKIINFFINKKYSDTKYMKNINIKWSKKNLSNGGYSKIIWYTYRSEVVKIFEKIINKKENEIESYQADRHIDYLKKNKISPIKFYEGTWVNGNS